MRAVTLMSFCSAVACPTRLRALFELGAGPRTIGQLASAVGVTQAAVSRHVATMREAGLVTTQRQGRCTIVRRRERRWRVVQGVLGSPEWEDG
jgi:DNA-binding transcriptional ArsR family regulator